MLATSGRHSGQTELHLQTDALKHAGCERLFIDKASGVAADRPDPSEALNFAGQYCARSNFRLRP